MNRGTDIKNPYELQRVVLAAITDEIQLDENLEPPFVRSRETNSQYMQLDTSRHGPTEDPANLVILLNRSMPRVNRLKMSFFAMRYFTPNINPRNNEFAFVANGVNYTAILATDNNLLGLARYQALASAMNFATGGVGEFTVAPDPTYPQSYRITNTFGRLWRFINSSNGVKKGRFLWGMNGLNFNPGTEATSHVFTYFSESYSRYIDVSSYELTQYTKIDTAGVDVPAEVIFRFFLTEVPYGASVFTGFTDAPSLNYNRSRSIASVDLQLFDEFREFFYIPPQAWSSFVLNIVMIAQM